jgi:cytochrome c oxidase assembly protein Cox11
MNEGAGAPRPKKNNAVRDPALEKDSIMDRVDAVTLSYTFFPANSEGELVASVESKRKL